MPDPKKAAWDLERRLERRERRREQYRRGLRPFAIAAWEISKEHNVGSLVRTAHAAAAREVLLVGERDWNVEAAKTAELYTSVIQLPDADALLSHVDEHAYTLVSIELHDRSVNLFDAVYPDRPCFLLGAELGGVPEELIDASAIVVQLPQWGLVPSLNLAIAGSIVTYDFLAKLNAGGKLDRPDGGLVFDKEPIG
jgi:tRNA G18 (ribose-2'-O)-methylase SpoU